MKQKLGHITIPLQRVHVELTNICDFDCLFCPKSEMKRPAEFMDTGLAKRIISELKLKEVCEKITLHVMGEPTMHPDFFDILDHTTKENIKVGLTTNGGRLGGATGQGLLDYSLHQIDISLQTPDETSFKLRKAGALTFDTYVDGIITFFSSYIKKSPDTLFKFRFLNTKLKKTGIEKKIGPVRVISSTQELRKTFTHWAGLIYDVMGVEHDKKEYVMKQIQKLVSYKWNVVEIYPNVFFETYILDDWGHAFDNESIRDAWAGCCFGMMDHFSILSSGDVTLCFMDYDGHTSIGNLHDSPLEDILSSDELGKIIDGFKRYRLVHPYCKKCRGSKSFTSWLLKPAAHLIAIKVLRPFLHPHIRIYK